MNVDRLIGGANVAHESLCNNGDITDINKSLEISNCIGHTGVGLVSEGALRCSLVSSEASHELLIGKNTILAKEDILLSELSKCYVLAECDRLSKRVVISVRNHVVACKSLLDGRIGRGIGGIAVSITVASLGALYEALKDIVIIAREGLGIVNHSIVDICSEGIGDLSKLLEGCLLTVVDSEESLGIGMLDHGDKLGDTSRIVCIILDKSKSYGVGC